MMRAWRHIVCWFLLGLMPAVAIGQNTLERARHALFKERDFVKATRLYNEVLSTLEKQGSWNYESYINLAECNKVLGNYNKAALFLCKADSAARILNSPMVSDNCSLKGAELYTAMGRYDLADSLLGTISSKAYSVDCSLKRANLDYQRGHKVEAKRQLDCLLAGRLDTGHRAEAFQNRAFVVSGMSEDELSYEAALADIDSALALLPEDRDSYYIALSNKAIVEAQLGQTSEAKKHIYEAKKWFSRADSLVDYSTIVRKEAWILLRHGDKGNATKRYKEFFDKERKFLLRNFAVMTEQDRLNLWKKERLVLSHIFELEDADPKFLLDVSLMRRQVAFLGGDNTPKTSIERHLNVTGGEVRRALKRGEVAIDFVCYNRGYEDRYGAIVVKNRGEVIFVPLWDAKDLLQFDLGGGLTLIEAIRSKNSQDKNAIYQNMDLATMVWSPLQNHIKDANKVYFAPEGLLNLIAIEYLSSTVLNGRQLSRLTSLSRLCDRTKPQKGPSGTLLLGGLNYNRLEPLGNWDNLVVNHDAYQYLRENDYNFYFNPLVWTRDEVDSIVSFVQTPLTMYNCGEEYFKKGMGHYRNIHFATHGFSTEINVDGNILQPDNIVYDNSLLACGLAMSGVNVAKYYNDRDDGILSGRELCSLSLNEVDFVVLSACQSAQGRVSDEGPVGLVRGLKKAGARTIMASLWPVSDGATMCLMSYFYEAWREGKGRDGRGCTKSRALQFAQERLRATLRKSLPTRVFSPRQQRSVFVEAVPQYYDAPYYWAPFIIIDDI